MYEVATTIRGIDFTGNDFDGISPVDKVLAEEAGFTFADLDWLSECTLTGVLPCTIQEGNERRSASIAFDLPLEDSRDEDYKLRLALLNAGTVAEGIGPYFEEALTELINHLPANNRLICCFTCLYADYSPSGRGVTGMWCYRNAKAQYLAARSKADVMATPATEVVLETHLCPEWAQRVPGTGYRG